MTRVTSKSLNSTVSINRKMGSGSGIPPGQNPILYIRNLPFSTTPRDLQDMFEKFGTLRQIRVGNAKDTKGSAFVIFQDPVHAKTALQKMTGYAVQGRYLIIGFWQPDKEGRFKKMRTSSSTDVPKIENE